MITQGVDPSLHVSYKNSKIKQYFKEGQALRTETTINNTRDFGVGRALRNPPALRAIGFSANRRLLEVVPEERIKSIESVLTVVGGTIVHATEEFAPHNPPPISVFPEWSPVAKFGGYGAPLDVRKAAHAGVPVEHKHSGASNAQPDQAVISVVGTRSTLGISATQRKYMKVSGSIEFELIEQTSDKVVGRMPVQPGIQNPFGTVHAGATLWLADVCATVLAFGGAEVQAGQSGFPLAINLSASLLGNQKEGSLLATSVFVKKGKRLSVVRTTVTGEGGRLIADVTTSHVPAQ